MVRRRDCSGSTLAALSLDVSAILRHHVVNDVKISHLLDLLHQERAAS